MRNSEQPPREKHKQQPNADEPTELRTGGSKAAKKGEGQADEKPADAPSREEVIKTWRSPVTNQDEQEKVTNAGGDDIPNQEA